MRRPRGCASRTPSSARSRPRSPARSASSSICKARSSASASSTRRDPAHRGRHLELRPPRVGRRAWPRASAASGDLRGRRSGPYALARRRQVPAARGRGERRAHRRRGADHRHAGSRKGISLPDTVIALAAMTEKDRADLEDRAVGVDWIALSFVQRAEDVAEARKLVRGRAGVMAKIEKPSGAGRRDHRDRRRHHGGARRSRRRDAGGEGSGLQKQITRAARNAGKPVVVATQMLESMRRAGADPRRGVRRRHRGVRRRRRGDALGGMGGRQISGGGRRDHGPRRHRGWSAIRSTSPSFTPSASIPRRPAPMPSPPRRAPSPRRSISLPSSATRPQAATEPPRRPRAAAAADHRADPDPRDGRKLAIVWGLHCVLTSDPKTSTTWCQRPAASPTGRLREPGSG